MDTPPLKRPRLNLANRLPRAAYADAMRHIDKDGFGMSLLQNKIAFYNGVIEVNGHENEGMFIFIGLAIRRGSASTNVQADPINIHPSG